MVGIFSKFSVSKSGHRRTQSALEEREVLPQESEVTGANAAASAVAHGVEVAIEFKPVEHPIEPLDNDKPVECPLPEPSVLNDGRIWKERVSAANVRRRADLPLTNEGTTTGDSDTGGWMHPTRSNRMILPSLSAPEHNLVNLLEEYNASASNKYT